MTSHEHDDGLFSGLWQYFAPHGWATKWYWTDGCRGKVWNVLHGHGWRIGPIAAEVQPTADERKLLRLATLLRDYGMAKFGDQWWPGNAGVWLNAERAQELAELLDFADGLQKTGGGGDGR